ncbi:glycoside hydrolase family 28 protein [Pedobacter heparinus]|uniref:Glycoside hydrolase family 28 n=1 Tax=Pedobacter heparinus (strain ATCC 13125 / DSM 2366 / CIP 104194 / JCM 7457 / NBRC 12017 / NCIMB 9290 / NRRL B-14731 / HIM 762-3) TaxID=485917 RepID=C6Y1U4_PEDHD|nr:glycosyl hydrolase family 28 protein [Pedobacter heparinus]ACU05086.1 glycoside hydrolase family 28 [Pedobacter heparinus DSM 2366]
MKYKLVLLFSLIYTISANCQVKDQLITANGAVADGQTNNAAVIQQLIDKAAAGGGGRVIVPPGNFMSGPVFLKSGVDLHLELGARLLGSTDRADYGAYNGRPALVSAKNQNNISISGKGIIDGQGQELMLDIFKKLRSGEMKQDSSWLYKRPGIGRTMILTFTSCTNVKVTGVTLKDATDWVQDYRECNGVIIDGITVQSTAYWNNDGLDITDSKNVRITNCFINASDDALCFKSENPDSSCENVFVDNCTLRSSANGLKFGTRNSGGFRNFKIRNLSIFDTYRSAIALESVDGGFLENIDIQHVVAKNTGNAIFIRRGQRNTAGAVGSLKGIYIANVKVETPLLKPDQGYPIEGPPDHLRPGFDKMPVRPSNFHIYGHPFLPYNLIPSSIVGLPGYPVEDVTLENIEISYGGRANKNIAYIPLDKITEIPENPANYPEFSMFGELPAWGFYIRHAAGIKMINVKISYLENDFRPAMVLDDVKGMKLSNMKIPTVKELPVIQLNNTDGISFQQLEMPVTEAKGILKTNYR